MSFFSFGVFHLKVLTEIIKVYYFEKGDKNENDTEIMGAFSGYGAGISHCGVRFQAR